MTQKRVRVKHRYSQPELLVSPPTPHPARRELDAASIHNRRGNTPLTIWLPLLRALIIIVEIRIMPSRRTSPEDGADPRRLWIEWHVGEPDAGYFHVHHVLPALSRNPPIRMF